MRLDFRVQEACEALCPHHCGDDAEGNFLVVVVLRTPHDAQCVLLGEVDPLCDYRGLGLETDEGTAGDDSDSSCWGLYGQSGLLHIFTVCIIRDNTNV